uniref:DUF2267 domain-containing protein n=1 Tax=Pararhizobium sp. IMCC3301 TaxID=3067904 RepID=UPI00274296CB|nr:DUF2267 domain-containing protein [Pararhizobium sp. IMCC3301]
MQDLILRIAEKAGINEDIARQAVSIILSFLAKEGPEPEIKQLLDAVPGAREMVDTSDSGAGGSGLLGGMFGGGGVMAVFNELTGLGLEMGEVQTVAKETLDYSREKAGRETVDEIVRSIPGLSQFI